MSTSGSDVARRRRDRDAGIFTGESWPSGVAEENATELFLTWFAATFVWKLELARTDRRFARGPERSNFDREVEIPTLADYLARQTMAGVLDIRDPEHAANIFLDLVSAGPMRGLSQPMAGAMTEDEIATLSRRCAALFLLAYGSSRAMT